MRKSLPAAFIICFITIAFFAPDVLGQTGGVAINRNNTAADPSAALDVSSTSSPYQGMLIPRMTTANRNLIISPAIGLQVFNIDCGVTEYYTGTCWISMSQGLRRPDEITCSGTTDFCSGQSRTFTISAVPGATRYVWTAPAGSIITGQGSTTVTIVFGQKSGEVCVSAGNVCETTIDRCLDILINPAPALTGTTPSSICGSGAVTLSAAANSGVVNWYDAATGGTLLGTGTSFTTNITTTTTFYAEASLNGCTSPSRTAVVATTYPSFPPQPGSILGATVNVGGLPGVTYSVSPVANASTYSWTVPGGATINSGQGTNAISVTFGCSATGNITVIASNICGSNTPQTLSVSTTLPAIGSISGQTNTVTNATETYSISAIPNVINYTWTVTSGIINSGQGTNSISVTWTSNGVGSVSVVQNSACGTSSPQSISVNINYQAFTASGTGSTGTLQSFTVPSGLTSITIDAYGAQGGSTSNQGGLGARMKGTFTVNPGDVLHILVGQAGVNPPQIGGGGGGGGSFVTDNSNNLLIVAGGGGGAGAGNAGGPGLTTTTAGNSTGGNSTAGGSANAAGAGNTGDYSGGSGGGGTCCSGVQSNFSGGLGSGGGAGFTGNGGPGQNGQVAALSFTNGGTGGYHPNDPYGSPTNSYGGFGGGGGGVSYSYQAGGGGGGGYSGGGGGTGITSGGGGGGGGGSYNSGTSQTNTSGVQSGNGQVIITY